MDLQTAGDKEPEADSAESTGTLPPPRPQVIDWRLAIQCAVAVAAVGGFLALGSLRVPVLASASVLWTLSGSLITLGLYHHRRPESRMDARIGARIGLMVGLCLAAGLAIAMAGAGVVARFGLKAMAGFDAQIAAVFEKVVQQSAQQTGSPLPADAVRLIHSPEFRAAYVLLSAAFTAAMLLVLSAAAGAFGGLLRTRQRNAG